MITLKHAELLIGIITFLLAYLIVITGANVFRTWLAKKMGDDTGEQLGFLTLNPLVHIDPVGIIFLLIFYFGWGRMVPINPFNIHAPFRQLKLGLVYASDTLAHFALGVGGIVGLLALFDVHILDVVRYMALTHNVSHLYIAHMYPMASTLTVVIGFILFVLVYLNIILSVLNFIINMSHFLLLLLSERLANIARYAQYITILLPIILILFFSGLMRLFAVNLIAHIGYVIASMLGLAT